MEIVSTKNFMRQQKLLRTLEDCKQIPKDDRLMIRKLIHQGNHQATTILEDHKNKKIQVRLRKFIQRHKQKKKRQDDKKKQDQQQNCQQQANEQNKNMLSYLLNYQEKNTEKKTRTEPNSLKSSACYHRTNDQPLKTLQNTFNYQYTLQGSNNSQLFTNPHLLDDIKQFSRSSSKQNITENFIETHIFEPCTNIPLPNNSNYQGKNQEETREYLLKNILISLCAEDLFAFICNKHFPATLPTSSVYLPYRKLLEEIKFYSGQNKFSSFPSSLNNSRVEPTNHTFQGYNPQGQQITSFISQSSCKIPVLHPFQSEFQSVTIEKLGKFLGRYCLRKNNDVRNMFIIVGADDDYEMREPDTISLSRFKKINQWKGSQLIQKFEDIVKKWGSSQAINYWRMYSLKDLEDVRLFLRLYHNN